MNIDSRVANFGHAICAWHRVERGLWRWTAVRVFVWACVRALRFCLGSLFVLLSVVTAVALGLAVGLVLVCRQDRIARCLRLSSQWDVLAGTSNGSHAAGDGGRFSSPDSDVATELDPAGDSAQ